jgi:hypothetical protein
MVVCSGITVVCVRMVVMILVLVTVAEVVMSVITFGKTRRRKMGVGVVVAAVLVHHERQRWRNGHQDRIEGEGPQLTAFSH